MEDGLKILEVEYLRNHWLDLPQISKLGPGDQIRIKSAGNVDDLQQKMTLNISATFPMVKDDVKADRKFSGGN